MSRGLLDGRPWRTRVLTEDPGLFGEADAALRERAELLSVAGQGPVQATTTAIGIPTRRPPPADVRR